MHEQSRRHNLISGVWSTESERANVSTLSNEAFLLFSTLVMNEKPLQEQVTNMVEIFIVDLLRKTSMEKQYTEDMKWDCCLKPVKQP